MKNVPYQINIDNKRDDFLTDFGKAVLTDRYLLNGESFQDLFARIARHYADNQDHAQRIYDYVSQMWFMPATPILSNGGTTRGMPISCFLNEVSDSLSGIVDVWNENVWLAAKGGGIGTYWGNVRALGEKVKDNGKTSGIIPFICVQDRLTLAISQGSLRRGSSAVYLPVWHPEIEEFIEIRRPTGGDPNRKSLNLHHGVLISDAFMEAVENDTSWHLKSPKDGRIASVIKARDLWIRILLARVETGEPYVVFIDTVNRLKSDIYKKHNLEIKTSNLCSEITLTTGKDYIGKQRTAVCCLSSLNLEYFDVWSKNELFIPDVMRFLDNVMEDFIKNSPEEHANAAYSASRERSVGLGVMGFFSKLQQDMVPIESAVAKSLNKKFFTHIKKEVDRASVMIAEEKGACPDAKDAGINERFSHKTAIAPTASISVIAGNASPGIEPYSANTYTQKTLTGSFSVLNKHLKKLLHSKGKDIEEIWSSIMNHEGSVQHLDFLTQHEKDVFKTAFEIDQRWLIDLAADRTPMIDQASSLNIFLPANVSKRELHMVHFQAWKKGVKSMYYLRSKSLQRADKVSLENMTHTEHARQLQMSLIQNDKNDEECLACQ